MKARESEKGAVLPLVAGILVALLAFSALAIDLGWLYLNSNRLQRAADAAALAGVVHLPIDPGAAEAAAVTASGANGFTVTGGTTLDSNPLGDNRLQVTISATAPTFFAKAIGIDTFSLSRRATAEYVKPVPIGSPTNEFGAGGNALWASINGRWTAHIHGDPYQSECDWATSPSNCVDSSQASRNLHFSGTPLYPGDIDSDSDPSNPEYTGDGYYYGVEIQPNRTELRVDLYEPAHYVRSSGSRCNTTLGDCDNYSFSPNPGSSNGGPDTRFRLYAPDETPLDPTDNSALICDREYDATRNRTSAGADTEWYSLCDFTPNPNGGIYVLRVTTNNGFGTNQYGVRATTSGPGADNPRVYGINQVSIYTNQSGSTSKLWLAEVDPIHAGKTLEVRFFDAGEDDSSASLSIKRPDDTTATCSWESESGESDSGTCTIQTTFRWNGDWVGRFNGQWLTAHVEIPDGYDCDLDVPLDCWWYVNINNSQPHDRTTWEARIIGNPVRLVPNE